MQKIIKYQVEIRSGSSWVGLDEPLETVMSAIGKISDNIRDDFVNGESGNYTYRIAPVVEEESE